MRKKALINPEKYSELEYQSVRAEILKRIELRQQIIQINLTFAGVLIGVGAQTNNPLISSIYPPLAFCFAMLWAQNDIRGRQLGQYIREVLEGGKGKWEAFYKEKLSIETMLGKYPLSIFAPGGAFIISELIAILFFTLGIQNKDEFWWVLLVMDALSLLGTIILLQKALRNRRSTLH